VLRLVSGQNFHHDVASIRQLGSVHSMIALHILYIAKGTGHHRLGVRCVLSSLCCVPPLPLLSPSAGPGLRPWLETGLVLTDTAVKSCRAEQPCPLWRHEQCITEHSQQRVRMLTAALPLPAGHPSRMSTAT